jgi:ribose-phosphate pyrophosphokinase
LRLQLQPCRRFFFLKGKSMTQDTYNGNVLITTPGMHDMGDRIAELLASYSTPFSRMRADVVAFQNGELKPEIPDSVRGMHAFLLAELQEPDPNVALMQMLLTANALKLASVTGITLVLPYIPYLRQDRKDKPRVPISARLLADLIESNKKIERVITLDMHADQEQGFFSIPVDNINAMNVHAEYFRKLFNNDFSDVIVVAPDFGSAVRSERFARHLGENVPVSIIRKRRPGPNQSEVLSFIGPDVQDRRVIIYDDMVDTGGTNRGAVKELFRQRAEEVYTCVTHGIFSGTALKKFEETGQQVIVTPSIPRSESYRDENKFWLFFVSIDELLANAIHEASVVGGSISKLSI